ncbi:zinc-dependent peptidase, partial [Neptunomonas phycophila]|uniref:zinc-dependent peptidase n=1 Tax=Neptunomonas phycophila TaxID=1572645 RepID=UPI0026E1966E
LDGECDGYPERFKEYAYSIPWVELVRHKTNEIEKRKSNIGDYASTNRVEFFAVASVYFFERPQMMKDKHPKFFDALSVFYQQDVMDLEKDVLVKS